MPQGMEPGAHERQDMETGELEEPEGKGTAERAEQGPVSYLTLCPSSPLGPWLTQAAGAIKAAGKTTGTGAHVAPGCVGAVAPRAEARHTEALVHICVDRHRSQPCPHQP